MSNLASLIGDGDGPAIVTARSTTENVRVSREGTVVVLQIGNSIVRMQWRTALKIGQWLMSRSVEAKVLDGDTRRLVIDKEESRVIGGGG